MMHFGLATPMRAIFHLLFLVGLGLLVYWLFQQKISRKDILAWAVGLIFLPIVFFGLAFFLQVPGAMKVFPKDLRVKKRIYSQIKKNLSQDDWRKMREEMNEHFKSKSSALSSDEKNKEKRR